MRIGFTGTRNGMTDKQADSFVKTVEELTLNLSCINEFHHGDCVGADQQAHGLSGVGCQLKIVHPPIDPTHRAFVYNYAEIREPKSHFARNRDIVNETDLLIACPPYMTPIVKETMGGTAYTVKYARKQGKPVVICWPDGTVTKEEGGRR